MKEDKMKGQSWKMGGMLLGLVMLGIFLLSGTTALAQPQYAFDCTKCHTMPPRDSHIEKPANPYKKDPFTGAVPGRHQSHAADGSLNSCAKCHGDVSGYGTSHRDKVIQFRDTLGYGRKPVDPGFMNQTSVPPNPMASCSTAACHSNGKGTFRATPAWNSIAAASCDTCHDSTPTTNKHTMHISTYSFGCVKCHSDHSAEAKPFQHATSAGSRNIDVHFTAAPNSGGNFATDNCSNMYCHSDGTGNTKTVSWTGAGLDCKGCHNSDVASGAAMATGKHGAHVNNASILGTDYGCVKCHSTTVSDNATISNRAEHVDGTKDVSATCTSCHTNGKGTDKSVVLADWSGATTLDCTGCHGSEASPAFASIAGEPNYTSGAAGSATANTHQKHVTGAADCQNCHSKTTTTGSAIIAGSQHIDGFINFTSGNGKTFGKEADKNCSNISCHSGGGRVKNVQNAQWGATLNCQGCHTNANLTGAHAAHVTTRSYGCQQCHVNTADSALALKSGTVLHMNYSTNITLASGTYNGSLSCSTTACHGTGTPTWNVATSGQCGSCHNALSGTTNGLIATSAHTAHFSAAYGPGMNGATATDCSVCHIYTGTNSATHPNNNVNLAGGFSANGTCTDCHKQTTNWTGGRVSCESCHSTAGGALSVIGGQTAPNKTLAATAGHGSVGQGCTSCHDNTAAHISGTLGDATRLLGSLGTGNTNCTFCHDDSGKVSGASLNVKAHRASGLGSLCSDCHNVHGTTNSMMVNTTINSTAVSFTGNNTFANGSNNGVCQVCHTTTEYFKANGTGLTHVDSTTNCLECHEHSPVAGLAFAANGACDACHGYPPAPRKLLGGADQTLPAAGYANSKFENYSGGGGAHLVAAHVPAGLTLTGTDADWTPCLPCHSDGKNTHNRALPLRNNVENVSVKIDQKYRFSNDYFAVYTTAVFASGGTNKTGGCFNVSCHFTTSPKWSIER